MGIQKFISSVKVAFKKLKKATFGGLLVYERWIIGASIALEAFVAKHSFNDSLDINNRLNVLLLAMILVSTGVGVCKSVSATGWAIFFGAANLALWAASVYRGVPGGWSAFTMLFN